MLGIVIVSHNSRECLSPLLRGIQRASEASGLGKEVVVVDNASSDGAPDLVRERFPWVHLVRMPLNVGYGTAANEGIRQASGSYVLLLNPDIVVPESFFERLEETIDWLEQNRNVAVLGPMLRNEDGSYQYSAGRHPTFWRVLFGQLRPRAARKYVRMAEQGVQKADWVTGAALLLRKEVVQRIGGFDENIFMYYEDTDLCRRAANAGHEVVYDPRVWLTHLNPSHNRGTETELYLHMRRSQLCYFRRHNTALGVLGIKCLVVLLAAGFFAQGISTSLLRSRRAGKDLDRAAGLLRVTCE